MLFNSLSFMIFFPVVVMLYFVIPSRYKNAWLLLCSYFFYFCQDNSYTLLLIASTLITWYCGRLVSNSRSDSRKKLYIAAGFILNIFMLFYFKYMGFVFSLVGHDGIFNLMLPAGISFYTFQSLTYIMDCYRGDCAVENNIINYALFVSFFPNILSGPIERARNMLPQLRRERSFDALRAKEGLFLMLWGYFLKMVIASRLAILTEYVYSNEEYHGIPMLVAMLAYSFEIYCDFAGYSSVAIGAARILGFDVMRNFRQPYLAVSIADFWRRWHISLSTWFRDYLYIPLGGNRLGKIRQYINVMIVFLVSGLWHGANLTFVLWGFLHGIYQIIGYLMKPVKEKTSTLCKLDKHNGIKHFLSVICTYILVSIAWIFFRADSIGAGMDILARTFSGYSISLAGMAVVFELGLGKANLLFVMLAVAILILVDIICERKKCDIFELLNTTHVVLRWAIYYFLITMIIFSSNLSTQEFIYQKF